MNPVPRLLLLDFFDVQLFDRAEHDVCLLEGLGGHNGCVLIGRAPGTVPETKV